MRKLLGFAALLVSFYSYSQVSFCGGSSTVISAGNPSQVINPTYSMNPGGVSSASGNYTISPSANTTFTIYTTGTPSTGTGPAITTASVITVTVSPMPMIAPSFTQASCTSTNNAFNLNLTFNPPSPVPAYSVQWVNTAPLNITSISQFSAANSAPGPYTTVITAAGGCTLAYSFTIDPPPALANFTVIPFGNSHTITCVTPTVVLNTNNANLTYTWSATSFTPVVSSSITLDATMLGTISVTGQNPTSNCTATYTFLLTQNITVPTTSISPTFTTLTCAQPVPPTISVTANPSVNITHYIYSPQGGTFTANSYTAIYYVGGIGEFTHCAVYDNSGCQTCKTFTINSTSSPTDFPTFSVQSTQQFTLGCGTKSVCPVKISNPQGAGGGAASYTLIGPPTTGTLPLTGTLSSVTDYSVTVPGTWTVVVRDNVSFCETRIPVSVTQHTAGPGIEIENILIPKILNCKDSTLVLKGLSTNQNVQYNWGFPFPPGNFANPNLTVNTLSASPGQSVVANFTLTGLDTWNMCISTLTVPVYQNIYKPIVKIAATPTVITCKTPTVTLTNQSSTGIPSTSTLFPSSKAIAGLMWMGPSPQEPIGPSSSYLGGVVGIYTLQAMDLNNYCKATATLDVADGRTYPSVTLTPNPVTGGEAHIDCGANSTTINANVTNMPTTNLTYTWSGGPFDVQDGGKNKSTYTPDKPGRYAVLVQNTVTGCAKRSDTINVTIGVITSKFSVNTDNGYAPLTVEFTNQSSSVDSVSGTSNIQSIWNYGNGDTTYQKPSSYSINPTTVFNQPGTYTVVLYVGKGACMDTSMHVIKVDIPSELQIPNVFTPNGDNVNDIYFLKTSNLSSIEMSIYDRWGHLTYELKSGNGNVAWDGKNQYGKDCAEGTYFYVLKATGKDGATYDKKGTINLYR
ncbi:MAG: gliding motility-associated C-terminal domain-containing protein [Bacteroidia bacterium]|nr:gliding motility-associated C-terminal domain-containing protein [Bacteroidia bacterium]